VRPPPRSLGLGLVYQAGTPWSVRAEDFAAFRSALGDELLVAFCRAFTVTNKLMSIIDLMGMNYKLAKGDEVRLDTNHHFLGLLASGYAHELSEVLTELRRAGVEEFLSDEGKQRWAKLVVFERFAEKKMIKIVRDELAFHPGYARTMRAGLDRLAKEKQPVDIFRGDGSMAYHSRVDLGLVAAFAGLQLDVDSLRAAFTEVHDLHMLTLRELVEVFGDVLRSKGADLGPLGPTRT
jgi:hypothetical protein